jgi:iron complex outermembrane receptor protein
VLGRPGGSQGFPGFRPANELDEARSNVGAYLDTEVGLTKQLLVSGAVRFERYSDFGNTFNVKLASRLAVSPALALRGAASTGYRAPSLAQIYFNSTFTDFVSGVPIDKIIARNDGPIARALGIAPLKQETARNASLGFTATLPLGLTATVDGYYVGIRDRVVLTGAFGSDDPDIGASLEPLGVGAAQFFTNALDTETWGLDVILTCERSFGAHDFRLSYAGNFNHMELGDVHTNARLAGKEDLYFGRREKYFLLASAPPSKMSVALDYRRDRLHASLQLVRFGEVTLIDFIDSEDVYDARTTTDLMLGYDLTRHATLFVGGANLFNVYPSSQDTETETGGMWDAVQMGFGGRFYYGRLNIRM